MKVKVTQSCLTLCDPVDYTVHGILQTRILEWWPFPSPGDFPNLGIKPRSPALQADSLPHLQLRQEPQGTSAFRLRSQGPCRLGTGESGLVLG